MSKRNISVNRKELEFYSFKLKHYRVWRISIDKKNSTEMNEIINQECYSCEKSKMELAWFQNREEGYIYMHIYSCLSCGAEQWTADCKMMQQSYLKIKRYWNMFENGNGSMYFFISQASQYHGRCNLTLQLSFFSPSRPLSFCDSWICRELATFHPTLSWYDKALKVYPLNWIGTTDRKQSKK